MDMSQKMDGEKKETDLQLRPWISAIMSFMVIRNASARVTAAISMGPFSFLSCRRYSAGKAFGSVLKVLPDADFFSFFSLRGG